MDISSFAQLFCELIGGLGIFLLGMKNMSEGMQAVAGSRLRQLIGAVTSNRVFAALVGLVVTCVVQSSSITTVMVVGFVNSGVMELSQAIGIIMGANIGTTITGWILVLKIGKYGLPLLGAAAFVYLFSKGDRYRYWAMSLMGVGMVFFGLELMKDACSIIKETPAFLDWFQRFQADTYFGVLGCALAGCLLTTLVQSSSATLGITISLAYQGILSFETAAALVLGENIGTTITALLASLGATTNARRAAYFHVIFNLFGVFWITLIFGWYVEFIPWLISVDPSQAVVENGNSVFPHTTPAIAATHSVFNVVNTLLFLPFVPVFVTLLNRIVPPKEFKEKPRLTDLDIRILETPLLAIEQSRKEIQKMSDACTRMLTWCIDLRDADEPDANLSSKLRKREQILDSIHDEIAEFVTDLLSGSVPHSVAEEARQQLRMADEYESVSDYITSLERFDRKLRKDGHRFTETQREDLGNLHAFVAEYLREVNEGFVHRNRGVLLKTEKASRDVRDQIRKLRQKHLDDLSSGQIPPVVSVAFLAALNSYGRVRDHLRNIAEAVSGEK